MKQRILIAGLSIVVAIFVVADIVIASEQSSEEQSAFIVPGITLPYHNVTLGPLPAGRIADIKVKEGDMVKKGQVLVELDSSVQKLKTEIAKIVSDAMKASMQLEKVQMQLAQEELHRITKLVQEKAASSKELQDSAKLATIATAKYQKALLMYKNAVKSYELEQLKLREMSIYAPFDGYISKILKEAGESVDEREGVVSMVQINPLKVYFDCPIALAGKIKLGDTFEVKPADTKWKPDIGKVIFISPSADPASQTFRVKIEIPNKNSKWFAGIKVYVNFANKVTTKQTK